MTLTARSIQNANEPAMMTSPTHSKSQACLQSGIFDELESFRELETRIVALPTAQERGAAFEVFAEAYLAVLAVDKAKAVWPGSRIPPMLLKRLALRTADMGVDGIIETQLGEVHAYQAKFRTGRPSLNWTELSTFIGIADRADARVLITNCDTFAGVVGERSRFYAITGNDLDKLEPQDFAAIHTWLAGKKNRPQRKTPLPHQGEGIDDLLAALREHDRATGLMACGTGKTLVALWVAERMDVRSVLVLVPSLALLGQMLHEWSRETSWPALAHLCVCSDPAVKSDRDEIILRSSDLDFPVTTDSAQVRAFLAAKFDGVKLIFSTYQSAHVVAAGMQRGESFDLAIFDEAHKTAGREGVHFGFALSDKNLAIRKRLFLTATPRHYDLRKRDKEGDARLVYSMDAPEIYGPVAHQLTFAEAARRGIICHYRVIISVVTSGMVNDHLLRHGEVLVQGDPVQARHVASQLALQAAVAEHGTGKIFTFHRSVASAASFVGHAPRLPGNRSGRPTTGESIANHLPGFGCFHVNGTMPMSERNGIMREFRAASRAVISNARCLTEGVDMPAVDMVAFLTPKRSRVDIVQATGRAMRKAAGKTTGYVLVPLFVEQAKGETIKDALARTEFDEVWNVLQAMQEQDETLAEIIRQMREERGRTKGFDDTRFREKVEFLGPQISLEALRDSITTACVEVLGENWDEWFGVLQRFNTREGHCRVPATHREGTYKLGMWVSGQRRYRDGMPVVRRQKLEELGFEWDPLTSDWLEGFAALERFRAREGHCRVPHRHREGTYRLGLWVGTQRGLRDGMSDERRRRLETLGFEWDPFASDWEDGFVALQRFKARESHCRVPSQQIEESYRLGRWVLGQRKYKDNMPGERRQKLEALGFEWDPFASDWEDGFVAFERFRAREGHCRVVARHIEGDYKLGMWVCYQRTHRNSITLERKQRLEALGFEWDPHATAWEDGFAALERFRAREGHCRVVQKHVEGTCRLGQWVRAQREGSDKMPAERRLRMEALGFDWDPFATAWEDGFAALEKFKARERHCRVPKKHLEGTYRLGLWVGTQRGQRDRMTADRRQRLEALGFEWRLNVRIGKVEESR